MDIGQRLEVPVIFVRNMSCSAAIHPVFLSSQALHPRNVGQRFDRWCDTTPWMEREAATGQDGDISTAVALARINYRETSFSSGLTGACVARNVPRL